MKTNSIAALIVSLLFSTSLLLAQPAPQNSAPNQPGKPTQRPPNQQPSNQQPSNQQPSAKQPSAKQPSTKQPSTKQPSTKQPSTKQPSPDSLASRVPPNRRLRQQPPTPRPRPRPWQPGATIAPLNFASGPNDPLVPGPNPRLISTIISGGTGANGQNGETNDPVVLRMDIRLRPIPRSRPRPRKHHRKTLSPSPSSSLPTIPSSPQAP